MTANKALVLDQILKYNGDKTVLAIPRGRSVADFEFFTAKDLDVFADRAVKHYHQLGLRASDKAVSVIALVGPSDLDYIVTILALSRLGYAVLLLSTRLAPEPCTKLMKENSSDTIIQSPSALASNMGHVVAEHDASIRVLGMASASMYRSAELDQTPSPPSYSLQVPDEKRQSGPAIILHSSGSTGLPKSVSNSHQTMLARMPTSPKAMIVSPLYHAYACRMTFAHINDGECIYLANPELPQTSESLAEMLGQARPDLFLAVPYNLKLLAELPIGIDALKDCKAVLASGSPLSTELGDRLEQAGVNIAILFGSTEAGMVGSSLGRSMGDSAWNYMRLGPERIPHIIPKPIGDNHFEFVYRSTWPNLNASNSNDPPGSFHSSDVFTPHPTIANAWKFVFRIDDRVTLSNGEKVLPLPFEGRLREEALVRDAVVFGLGRPLPGLLLFRSDSAASLEDGALLDAVWPAIQAANSGAESFGRIMKEMVIVMPAGTVYPTADKGSIMRMKIYNTFAEQIDQAYAKLEAGDDETSNIDPGLVLDAGRLQAWLLQRCRENLEIDLADEDTDLYQAGMDSLKSTQLRSLINKMRPRNTQSSPFPLSAIFAAGTVRRLAEAIVAKNDQTKTTGAEDDEQNQFGLMQDLSDKYSEFGRHESAEQDSPNQMVILLTGATGSLGAHLLAQLVARSDVSKVYCIVRGADPTERVAQSLRARRLPQLSEYSSKIVALAADLSHPDFNLPNSTFSTLRAGVTHIIHSAWPVNFQIGLAAFEPHIRGLHNLLQFSLSVQNARLARLFFCSSISVALNTAAPATIPDSRIAGFSQALPSGYARSKLVGERIIEAAVARAGADAAVLRIGQVIADTKEGVWNDSEAWPLMIRSAGPMGALPALDVTCSWLPVDTLAASIIDLLPTTPSSSPRPTASDIFYNLENPHHFHWTTSLLPLLHQHTNLPSFTTVPTATWLTMLKEYSESKATEEEAVQQNPAVKLLEYFEGTFGAGGAMGGATADGEEKEKEKGAREITFATTRACKDSAALRQAPDVMTNGVMEKTIEVWLAKWKGEVE